MVRTSVTVASASGESLPGDSGGRPPPPPPGGGGGEGGGAGGGVVHRRHLHRRGRSRQARSDRRCCLLGAQVQRHRYRQAAGPAQLLRGRYDPRGVIAPEPELGGAPARQVLAVARPAGQHERAGGPALRARRLPHVAHPSAPPRHRAAACAAAPAGARRPCASALRSGDRATGPSDTDSRTSRRTRGVPALRGKREKGGGGVSSLPRVSAPRRRSP